MEKKEKLFQEFLSKYLDNVKAILPDSYRARQYDMGGTFAGLVVDFESRFLKQPFMEALEEWKKLNQ